MRIALCLRGLASGRSKGSKIRAFERTAEETWGSLENIIQGNDFDIFCHTWSVDKQEEINSLYRPKKILAEKQKIFDNEYVRGMENSHDSHFNKKLWVKQQCNSQVYSIKKTIDLKNEYEKDNDFNYDVVFILRYDQHFHGKFDYSSLSSENSIVHPRNPGWSRVVDWEKEPNWDGSSKYPWMKKRVWDTWWASSSKSIQNIADCYDTMNSFNYEFVGMHHLWDDYFKEIRLKEDLIEHQKEISFLNKNEEKTRIYSLSKAHKEKKLSLGFLSHEKFAPKSGVKATWIEKDRTSKTSSVAIRYPATEPKGSL